MFFKRIWQLVLLKVNNLVPQTFNATLRFFFRHRSLDTFTNFVPCNTKSHKMSFEETSADRNVEIWKIKKLIKSLEMARGNGTSMVNRAFLCVCLGG